MAKEQLESIQSESVSKRIARRSAPILYSLVFAVSMLLACGYHLVQYTSGLAPERPLQLLYAAVVSAGLVSGWKLVSRFFKEKSTSPGRLLWSVLVTGVVITTATSLMTSFGTISAPGIDLPIGFAPTTGVPLTAPTVFKMVLVSLAQVAFIFILLARFGELVLVKRTTTSLRNWFTMLGVMVAVSLLVLFDPPGFTPTFWHTLALIVSVCFMVVNAFRLSWIVPLSFKEKIAAIFLCMAMIVVLVLGPGGWMVGNDLAQTGSDGYLEHFFMPLASFIQQATFFGILYSSTSFLSLLFHLPTTGDFRQREGERATMHSLAALVGQVFDAEKLFSTVAAAPVESGAADAAWLALPDVQSGFLDYKIVSTHGIVPARVNDVCDTTTLAADVARNNLPELIQQAPADRRLHIGSSDGIGSLLIVPLMARDEMIGALFASKKVSKGFEPDDVETISIFAAQAAVAIDNAHLFEQQIERERLEREMSIAREVQRKLLPQSVPEISGVSMSAQEVGGDYYEFVRLDENRVGVIIGDVSGKGTSAAFYMAEMQGIFHSVSQFASTPSIFLTHANAALAHSLDRNVFISAIYAILDLESETLEIARAGHCPAALVRLSGESRYIRTKGLGLGLDRGSLFEQCLSEEIIPMEPGDVFAFYTDGVVESRNAEGEEYGYDRLLKILKSNRHEDADGLHAAVLRDLRGFIGSAEYDDDLTLVIVKWHGVPLQTATPSLKSTIQSD